MCGDQHRPHGSTQQFSWAVFSSQLQSVVCHTKSQQVVQSLGSDTTTRGIWDQQHLVWSMFTTLHRRVMSTRCNQRRVHQKHREHHRQWVHQEHHQEHREYKRHWQLIHWEQHLGHDHWQQISTSSTMRWSTSYSPSTYLYWYCHHDRSSTRTSQNTDCFGITNGFPTVCCDLQKQQFACSTNIGGRILNVYVVIMKVKFNNNMAVRYCRD